MNEERIFEKLELVIHRLYNCPVNYRDDVMKYNVSSIMKKKTFDQER